MASSARVFFAGVGTTFFILAIGFGGGLMLAKAATEPATPSRSVVDRLPPARIILPTSAQAAAASQPPGDQATPHQAVAPVEAPALIAPVKEAQQATEKDKQAERAERRKAEAEERARRRKYAERKARREAPRLAMQQQEQQVSRQQPGIMAFGRDDVGGSIFGN